MRARTNLFTISVLNVIERISIFIVPVANAFSGKEQMLLGPDLIHPNYLGHKLIDDLLVKY
ncbi:hypothetical protein ACHOLT_06955 [Desulfitobacterium sp. Sab5]|uniref:hypothetical protein n=1 Tax=Desulfitobacterium nosdiversum TaxID=3375356 RepID=UPI003CF79338